MAIGTPQAIAIAGSRPPAATGEQSAKNVKYVKQMKGFFLCKSDKRQALDAVITARLRAQVNFLDDCCGYFTNVLATNTADRQASRTRWSHLKGRARDDGGCSNGLPCRRG
ncbi:hypothetical protein [Ectopseudomonas composti]|uniref:hypothetical protein n=1 Tax=Ectopseudomonas composti TaxID=658457 RepID=UPI0012E3E297|nr:hypothetical protein [Pseudomonas composti]